MALNDGATVFPYASSAYSSSHSPDGTLLGTEQSTLSYDQFGNVVKAVIEQPLGHTKTTTSEYFNDPGPWILGKPTRTEVLAEAPGWQSVTRTMTAAYDPADGFLLSTTSEAGGADNERVTTTYSYDTWGNRRTTTVTGGDTIPTTSTTVRDDRGMYPVRTLNALSQAESYEYDQRLGKPIRITGPNGLTTRREYDALGRLVREAYPDGTETTWSYHFDSPPWRTVIRTTGSPAVTKYYDALGRVTRVESAGFDGTPVYVDTRYDEFGRAWRQSRPYYEGDPPQWTTKAWDETGRLTSITAPDGDVTTTRYDGLHGTVTGPDGRSVTTERNLLGQDVRVIDPLGNELRFEYDLMGRPVRTIDPDGNVLEVEYDRLGRRIAMSDPDMGRWTYTYDSLGRLTTQSDAAGQETVMTYDPLDRLVRRETADGISEWKYDTASMGIGKLARASSGGYRRVHEYDALGRPSATTVTIEGTPYVSNTTYDALGRVATATWPGGRVTVRNVYNPLGYLAEVRRHDPDQSLWRADRVDAQGRVLLETFGNGITSERLYDPRSNVLEQIVTGGGDVQDLRYTFDVAGNLEAREDLRQNRLETFTYDALNRLTSADVDGELTTVTYDPLGNITWKSGVGDYFYGEEGAGPHMLTRIEPDITAAVSLMPLAGQGAAGPDAAGGGIGPEARAGFHYDPNGNLLAGAGRTITWTAFNKPAAVTTPGTSLEFTYGPEHQRLTKDDGSKRTVYVGGTLHAVSDASGTSYRHLILAGSATVEVTRYPDGSERIHYLHTDHLGSTDAVTDSGGNVVERLSFDPWGQRRESDWTPSILAPLPTTPIGFTGHEHDDETGLINMNARFYDPVLARFLSPDPTIPGRTNLQTYNRYSYVNNNPLGLTDPSGLEPREPAGSPPAGCVGMNNGRGHNCNMPGDVPDNVHTMDEYRQHNQELYEEDAEESIRQGKPIGRVSEMGYQFHAEQHYLDIARDIIGCANCSEEFLYMIFSEQLPDGMANPVPPELFNAALPYVEQAYAHGNEYNRLNAIQKAKSHKKATRIASAILTLGTSFSGPTAFSSLSSQMTFAGASSFTLSLAGGADPLDALEIAAIAAATVGVKHYGAAVLQGLTSSSNIPELTLDGAIQLTDTFGISFNFSGGLGIGFTEGLYMGCDSSWNCGVFMTEGAGGYRGAGAGFIINGEWTNADNLADLRGKGYQVGISAGLPHIPIFGDGGAMGGNNYQGFYFGFGIGSGTSASYGFGTKTDDLP